MKCLDYLDSSDRTVTSAGLVRVEICLHWITVDLKRWVDREQGTRRCNGWVIRWNEPRGYAELGETGGTYRRAPLGSHSNGAWICDRPTVSRLADAWNLPRLVRILDLIIALFATSVGVPY
jgi:hypothetical protein